MNTHIDNTKEFSVTDIVRYGRVYKFQIYAILDDESTILVATHFIQYHQSLELFEYHHSECKRIYEGLE